jgi:uncharacterized protein (TIGR02145 family)
MKYKTQILISALILIGFQLLVISCKKDDSTPPKPPIPTTATDIDGNVYHTVKIGTQIWMVENLKTTRYNNGVSIQHVTTSEEWGNTQNGQWCCYDTLTENLATYGCLYSLEVVRTGIVAPVGWHVPTSVEFETLIAFLGGNANALNSLKESGTSHWVVNDGGNNLSGFTALPGGSCYYFNFQNIGNSGQWWSSTEKGWGSHSYKFLSIVNNACIIKEEDFYGMGYSIRCIFNYTY